MLTWVEISENALISNIIAFHRIVGKNVMLAPVLKANAYGHGLIPCAQVFEKNGADYLCVNAVYEAKALREAGIKIPILILGYTPLSCLSEALKLKCDLTVYNSETLHALVKLKKPANLHLKIETGTHRQGARLKDLPKIIRLIKKYPNLHLIGVSTHFANLEDRVNQKYAKCQLEQFRRAVRLLESKGLAPHFRHCSSTASAILMPEAYFNFVRPGIGCYGMWPSEKTKQAAKQIGINMKLKPALAWKTIVAQVKKLRKDSLIGYGCSYKMPRNGLIAVLPVGYYDGYVRLLSGRSYVLIRGQRAPIVGRICMNMCMADVTDIPNVRLEDEVVLIGQQGRECITAEQIAQWSQTINYEVTTRINEKIPRIFK